MYHTFAAFPLYVDYHIFNRLPVVEGIPPCCDNEIMNTMSRLLFHLFE